MGAEPLAWLKNLGGFFQLSSKFLVCFAKQELGLSSPAPRVTLAELQGGKSLG